MLHQNTLLKVFYVVSSFCFGSAVPIKEIRSNDAIIRNNLLPNPDNFQCGLHFFDKIIGGSKVALDEHPWTALLGYVFDNDITIFGCGGSLINNRYVLTAAHCIVVTPRLPLPPTFVRLGEWNIAKISDCIGIQCNGSPTDVTIEETIVHSDYVKKTNNRYDDIALVRLSEKVSYSPIIRPICLPLAPALQPRADHNLQRYTAVGWGVTENNTLSDDKLKVELPGVKLEECKETYKQVQRKIRLRETQMCAGGEAGAGSCSGDSGGPLLGVFSPRQGVNYNYLAGVISFGNNQCGKENWPGIFTNVGSYVDWIQDNVRA